MNQTLKLFTVITLVSLLILVVGMSGCASSPEPAANPPEIPQATIHGTEVGDLAPDIELLNLSEETVSLTDFRDKPVMVNFWASWCGPCVVEMPHIQRVHDDWKEKGLVILAVNSGESSAKAKEFIQYYGYSFPVLLDSQGIVSQEYKIRFFPTSYFIDKDGIIQLKVIGSFPSKEAIEKNLGTIIP